mmetsp:Transcript_27850/g.65279  ORF Transcript_27850/g.65279 Transcript_27850/m.65279 type:complete len:87 (+) Transcript_27850:883-1143(+)
MGENSAEGEKREEEDMSLDSWGETGRVRGVSWEEGSIPGEGDAPSYGPAGEFGKSGKKADASGSPGESGRKEGESGSPEEEAGLCW